MIWNSVTWRISAGSHNLGCALLPYYRNILQISVVDSAGPSFKLARIIRDGGSNFAGLIRVLFLCRASTGAGSRARKPTPATNEKLESYIGFKREGLMFLTDTVPASFSTRVKEMMRKKDAWGEHCLQ